MFGVQASIPVSMYRIVHNMNGREIDRFRKVVRLLHWFDL